jgi:uncharacterized protein
MTAYPKADLLPPITDLNAPFWHGLNDGVLRLQRCEACSSYQHPPESFCYRCGSDRIEWAEASGLGVVHTFITVHQRGHPAFADDIPYNVSVIQLDEGPRLLTNVVGVPPEQVRIDMRVRLAPRPVSETQHGPYFEPAE